MFLYRGGDVKGQFNWGDYIKMYIKFDFFTPSWSSVMLNSFFLTVLSWFRKLNSAAFFCNFANLFSYFETFFKVGLMLKIRGHS